MRSCTLGWAPPGPVAPSLLTLVALLVFAIPTAVATPAGEFFKLSPPAREAAIRESNALRSDPRFMAPLNRALRNRSLIETGALVPKSDEERRQLTAIVGVRNLPVFPAKYSDTGADPIPPADLQRMLFDGPWPTGTMTQYYSEVSYGVLTVTGNVHDWATLAGTDADYSGGDEGVFVRDALLAHDAAVDFGQFDNDGVDGDPNSGDDDGIVDIALCVVHPERPSDSDVAPGPFTSKVTSLTAVLGGRLVTSDPRPDGGFIEIDFFMICPALSHDGGMSEIGVYCHEFGHTLGLPDLYDREWGPRERVDDRWVYTTNQPSFGIGYWDLMAYGHEVNPERPVHMSAWSKAHLGWIEPTAVSSDLLNWPVASSTETPTAFKLWTHGDPGNEYFLVENRRRANFDGDLPGEGLLIWHVDEARLADRTHNDDETHKLVDLECADQTFGDHEEDTDDIDNAGNKGDPNDPFCNGDVFDEASVPSSVSYDNRGRGGPPVQSGVAVRHVAGLCGDFYMLADLIVGVDPGGENLCIRDCHADDCSEPTPCASWYRSPDIYIDNNEDGIIDAPAPGIENNLIARVRNPGGAAAADVTTSFYFVDPTLGLRFPGDACFIDETNTPIIGAGSSELAKVVWTVPLPPPEVDHYCIGAVTSSTDDPPSSERPPEDNNVAQINYQALVEKAGDAVPLARGLPGELRPTGSIARATFSATRVVRVCNPLPQTCPLQIVMGSPPDYDDAVIPPDWMVSLEFDSIVLPPGQCVPLRVFVEDSNPVHLDQAIVPLTLLCLGTPVGGNGMEFNIDNVRPRRPCNLEVARIDPPLGDFQPETRAIRVSWDRDDSDDLGFPEVIERWRIYSDTTPDFIPSPANLIAETCRDEDPRTTPYDHFTDLPVDPDRTWYKIIAVDRAGNESEPCSTQALVVAGVRRNTPATALRLAQNTPNPVSEWTNIVYAVPEDGTVTIEIFSVGGRRVRTLENGWRRAGTHTSRWDARDDRGIRVASGSYVYRLLYGGERRSQRMIVVR